MLGGASISWISVWREAAAVFAGGLAISNVGVAPLPTSGLLVGVVPFRRGSLTEGLDLGCEVVAVAVVPDTCSCPF